MSSYPSRRLDPSVVGPGARSRRMRQWVAICCAAADHTTREGAAIPPIVGELAGVGRRAAVREVFATVAIAALGSSLVWMQPWKLLVRTTLDETLPPVAHTAYEGHFINRVHRTTGTARIMTLLDGRRILRLENLRTTQGPQLRVWLSDARVANGARGFRGVGRHQYVDVGALRANRGNTNYAVPDDADIDDLSSVLLWCRRFGVAFGTAQLHRIE